jgi:uncharacterized protein (TIGR00251 family)
VTREEFAKCISSSTDGVALDIEVSAGASADSVDGVNPWRKRIKVSVAAEAREGEANRALLKFLAKVFHVPMAAILLISGEKSSQKRVKVNNISREQAASMLEAAHGRR